MKKIYLAGWSFHSLPSGLKVNWRDAHIKKLEKLIKDAVFIDPNKREMPEDDARAIFGRDLFLIKKSDYILVNGNLPLGTGTSQEIIIGHYFGVTPIVICGEDGYYKKKNIKINGCYYDNWTHPFVPNTAVLVETLEEAADYINQNKKIGSRFFRMRFLDQAVGYYKEKYHKKDKFLPF